MKIYETETNDRVYRHLKGLAIVFGGKRGVLSTSIHNGGYREDIEFVFNKDENPGPGIAADLRAPTYEEHLQLIAEELGLSPEKATGLTTAASMSNLSIATERYNGMEITAFVTGGVEENGGRAGDPAVYDELAATKGYEKEGTINIILYADMNLPPGTMTRALVTSTEAKTAALNELMADSRYSSGLATGSGTDGTIIICNIESETIITTAGKHSVFGEIVARVVKKALKEALYKQTGLSREKQCSILRRGRRFGINEESLWLEYKGFPGNQMKMYEFLDCLDSIEKDEKLVALTASYFHLMDELKYGLIDRESAYFGAEIIVQGIYQYFGVSSETRKHEGIEGLTKLYRETISNLIKEIRYKNA